MPLVLNTIIKSCLLRRQEDRADGPESGRSAASTEVINILPPGTCDKDIAVNPGGIMSKHVYHLKLLTGYCMHPGDGAVKSTFLKSIQNNTHFFFFFLKHHHLTKSEVLTSAKWPSSLSQLS